MSAAPLTAELTPIIKRVEVRCGPDRAFEIFTASIGEWWPLRNHSVYESEAASLSVELRLGGEIVETSLTGESSQWGTITIWEPGSRLAFTWHPGLPLDETTTVEVRFTPSVQGTLVELEHAGWERRHEPFVKRAQYDHGWDPVLEAYAGRASRA